MRKDQRLTKAKDFAAMRRRGKSWADRWLVLMARPNEMGATRFGFSVGRRLGNAVVRNKVKRRLREAARLAPAQKGWDLVIIARRDAPRADFHRLRRSVTDLLRRGGLLAEHPAEPAGLS